MDESIKIQALTAYGIETDTIMWDYDAANNIRKCLMLSNNFNRIYYVDEGECIFHQNGSEKQIMSGKVYIFPADTDYNLEQRVFDKFRHLYFHVRLNNPITKLTEFSVLPDSYEASLINFLIANINETPPKHAIHFFETLLDKVLCSGDTDNADDLIYNAKIFIDNNLQKESFTLDDILHIAPLDKSYFIRKFKRIYKKSPMLYYNDERLRAAYADLLSGESVTTVTYKYHYNSLSCFSLKFKKKFGFPPSKCLKFNSNYRETVRISLNK